MNWSLGQGQYGKVYLAQEINAKLIEKLNPNPQDTVDGKAPNIADLFKNLEKAELDIANDSKLYACKVVERKNLCKAKEHLIVSEI